MSANSQNIDINEVIISILQLVDGENNKLYNEIYKLLHSPKDKNNINFQSGGSNFNDFLNELKIQNNNEKHHFFKMGESFKLALLNVDYIDTFFNNLDKIKLKIPQNSYMFNWENGNLRLYKYDEKNKLILLNDNCGFDNCVKLVECFGDVVNNVECYNSITTNSFDINKLPENNEERYIMCYKILRGLGFEEVFNNNTYYFNKNKNNDIYSKLIRNNVFTQENLENLMKEANKGLLEVFNKKKVNGKQNAAQNTVYIRNFDKNVVVQNTVIPINKNNLTLDITPEIPQNKPFYGGVKEDLLKKHFYKLMDIIKNNEIQIEENTAYFLKDYEDLLNKAITTDYTDDVNTLMEYYHILRTYTTEAMLDKKLIKSLKELNNIQKRDDFNEKDFNEAENYEVSKERYIVEKQNMFKEILSRLYEYLNTKFPDLTKVFEPAQILFQHDFEIDINDRIKEASTERFEYKNNNRTKKNYYGNILTQNY